MLLLAAHGVVPTLPALLEPLAFCRPKLWRYAGVKSAYGLFGFFGHGLSYTTFKLDNPRVEPPEIAPNANAIVSVDVTNTGDREGDEVPQLYIHQRVSSVTRPVLELRGFQRVHLRPGEKTTAAFTLTPDSLALWNEDMKFAVEPGVFDILLGTSSAKTQAIALKVTAK